jgi:hypothetical protein
MSVKQMLRIVNTFRGTMRDRNTVPRWRTLNLVFSGPDSG